MGFNPFIKVGNRYINLLNVDLARFRPATDAFASELFVGLTGAGPEANGGNLTLHYDEALALKAYLDEHCTDVLLHYREPESATSTNGPQPRDLPDMPDTP